MSKKDYAIRELARITREIATYLFSSDDPDEFSLLLLNDVKEAVDIHVTDNGFDGNSLRTSEGVVLCIILFQKDAFLQLLF